MNYLLVLIGPTGVGKTALSISIAQEFNCPILSSDSRQIYKGIEIGTAAPTAEEQSLAKHYFVSIKDLNEEYSAGQYELDALKVLDEVFQTHSFAIVTGGSMMYTDALCYGMDDIPSVPEHIRDEVHQMHQEKGYEYILSLLKEKDPIHYDKVDRQNYRRVIHALEVCLTLGKPYSSVLTNSKKERPFQIIKIGLTMDRALLYDRINRRVDVMMEQGLKQEALSVYPLKHLNSLNTVGFKEWFDYFDGKIESEDKVIELIKQHSRNYAKRQLTWFRRDEDILWFSPNEKDKIIATIRSLCQ